jgi:hypothetical protein
MADNVPITAGSGTNIATQDRSGVHFQQILVTGMATVATSHVTVTNTATEILAAAANRSRAVITNYQTVPIYIGADGVSTSTGHRVDPGATMVVATTAIVDGITSASYTAAGEDDKVHVLQEYD